MNKKIVFLFVLLLVLPLVLPVIAQTEEIYEYNNKFDLFESTYGTNWVAQTFTPQASHTLTKVVLYAKKVREPLGGIIVSIKATDTDRKPTGEDLISKNILEFDISTEEGEIEIVFDGKIILEAGTKYAIVIRVPNPDMPTDCIDIFYQDENVYSRGSSVFSGDSGVTWELEPTFDFWFEEWGYAVKPSMSDTLVPFLPVLAIALAFAFIVLFFMAIVYLSDASTMPIEIIIVPLFCIITLCSTLLIIGIFGL